MDRGKYQRITKLRKSVIKGFKLIIKFLSKNRRTITLIILGILLGTGILYKILVESVIFIIVYVIRMINLETYLVVFSILKFLFTLIYPYLKYIPLWMWIPILIILIFLKAISKANYKLKKNHERLKDFVKNDLTQTGFINGCPGTGKTLLNMSLAQTLTKICNFFDNFWYFKLSTRITQEDENDTRTKGIKKSLNINIRDLSYKNQKLYVSIFLSFSYAQKKNEEFKNLDTFTRLSPPKEELDKCNSRFYNKINR